MTPSLCESCENVRAIRTTRSRFLLCELSLVDADYPKYPPQPVVECDGYQRKGEEQRDGPAPPAGPES
jgi:hypothetical protein